MTDLTDVLRWNANFVRGLAESVLNRARAIRSALPVAASPTAEPRVRRAKASKASAAKAKPKKKSNVRTGRKKKK